MIDQGAAEATASFAALGSAPFMAPEQVEGKKIGPATDVYGLGAILYTMLCDRPPHRGATDPDTLRRVLADDLIAPRRIRPEVSRDLEAICLKCLEKEPAHRYGSARELADDLGRCLKGESTYARPWRRWQLMRRNARRHKAALVVLAVTAACAMLLLWVGLIYESRLDARAVSPSGKRPKCERGKARKDAMSATYAISAWPNS